MIKMDTDVLMIDSTTGNDYCRNLCSAMASICSTVTLVTVRSRAIDPELNYNVMRWAPSKGDNAPRLFKLFEYISYLFRLTKYICVKRPDVVHFQFLRRERIESVFIALLHALRIKTVHTSHNVLPHEKVGGDRFFKALLYRSSSLIIAHSEYIKSMIVKDFGISADKFSLIPHGNYDNCLPSRPVTSEEARLTLNLDQKDEVLLFFGYIRKYKGIDLLISAFQQASAIRANLKLIIAGAPHSAENDRWCRELIAQSGLAHKIRFYSEYIPTDELPLYFCASDIVVLPYKNIYHSGVVHMAYTFGRPIIATNVGDFKEYIINGHTGYILEENSPDCLASTINKALSDKKILKAMGTTARRLSDSRYSWTAIALQTLTAYASLSITNSSPVLAQAKPL